jgi:flagella basal body P-ring formation protein FlgA
MQLRPRSALFAWLASLAVAAGLAIATIAPAQAQETAEPAAASGLDAGLEQQVRQLALDGSHAATPNAPRIDVVVGQLDPRLRLAPCQRIEPYLPEGTRPWGKSRIGLRCVQGSVKWNVYLPITVKVWGRALVAANAVAAGSVLTAADVAQADVDLAEDASAPLVDADAVVGRAVTRALKPGQSLRAAHLKPRQYFVAGEIVTVLAQGPGFSVASEAQALTNGVEGQLARVRTESGRVLTGQPVAERRVELGM